MKKVMSGLMIGLLAAVVSASAWACRPMHGGKPCATSHGEVPCERHHAEMDANKDGVITKKEFDAFHNQHFKEMDTNKDGKLSEQELAQERPMWEGYGRMGQPKGDLIGNRFDAADANKDGALTREEAKDMPMLLQHFDEIDANKDGKVTHEEVYDMIHERSTADGVPKAPEKK